VRPSRGWQACGWLLVLLSLVWMVMFAGCQKAGGGGGGGEPSDTPPPSSEPPTTPPAANPVVGITLTAGQTELLADGASSTTITAQTITSTGTPAPDGTVVNFTTNLGRFTADGAKAISGAVGQGTGMVAIPFISEAGVVGTATIIASVEGITQSLQIALVSPFPPSPPPGSIVGFVLTTEANTLRADGASSTTVSALLITSTGAPAPDGTAVTFATDLGRFTTTGAKTITAVTIQGTGTAVVPFISEAGVVGTATIVASIESLTQRTGCKFCYFS
jgi:hypothetical protein